MTGTITSTMGTITANTPALSATQTWNNAAVDFQGIYLNVTRLASSGVNKLIEIVFNTQVLFYVDYYGSVYGASIFNGGGVTDNNTNFRLDYNGLKLGNTSIFDIGLSRYAGGVWEINNGTAGTFRDLKLRELLTAASTTTQAGLNVPHGSAPTSPVDGDIWSTTAGMFIRVNGVTKTVTLT